jgi:hypothetical protein
VCEELPVADIGKPDTWWYEPAADPLAIPVPDEVPAEVPEPAPLSA